MGDGNDGEDGSDSGVENSGREDVPENRMHDQRVGASKESKLRHEKSP